MTTNNTPHPTPAVSDEDVERGAMAIHNRRRHHDPVDPREWRRWSPAGRVGFENDARAAILADRAARPTLTSPLTADEIKALSTVIGHVRRHKDWLDVEDGMFEWEGLIIAGLFRRVGNGQPATSLDEERLAALASEREAAIARAKETGR